MFESLPRNSSRDKANLTIDRFTLLPSRRTMVGWPGASGVLRGVENVPNHTTELLMHSGRSFF